MEKLPLKDCAKNWNIPIEEIKTELESSGLYPKRVTVATTIDEETARKLKALLDKKRGGEAKPAAPKTTGTTKRNMGGSQVVTITQSRGKGRSSHSVGGVGIRERLLARKAQAEAKAAPPPAKTPATPAAKADKKPATKTAAAKTAAAAKPATAVRAQKAPPPTSAAQRGDAYSAEALVKMQEQRQQKPPPAPDTPAPAAAAAAPAAATPAPPPPPREAKPPKKSKKIKIDKDVLARRKSKHKQQISRREAMDITAGSAQHAFQKPTEPVVREVKIPDAISVSRLASEMSLKSGAVIRRLMGHGMSVTANEMLDKETAWIIVEELGHKPVEAPIDDAEQDLRRREEGDNIKREPRAPVVTVMGHVDHGKTSLLDYLRKTRVAAGESGGITQHMSAYRVASAIGEATFLDTPGHELFTQMRARGANITDIIILVVAADDGVKPQTMEAINHAKAANVPIVVAASKMDKPDADLERVKSELSAQDVLPEDWGGDAIVAPISAHTGAGVDKLLEAVSTQAEILELSAPINVPARAVVVETRVDRGRGIVAALVVVSGVLRRGDAFLCGAESGRVRAIWNAANPNLSEARPSEPVEMQGLTGVPEAGSQLYVMEDERKARELAAQRQSKNRSKKVSHGLPAAALPAAPAKGEEGKEGGEGDEAAAAALAAGMLDAAQAAEEWQELKAVVKADVEGSREAMVAALSAISGKRAGVKVIHSAVGAVTESDIYLAQTGGGVVVAFNTRPNGKARKLAEERNVRVIAGDVVYELVEKARAAVVGMLSPVIEEKVIGTAEVAQVFGISKVGNIAGCRVVEGRIPAKSLARLLRDGAVVYEGRLSSLRHFKEEVSEARAGGECGIGIAKFNDIKAGDVIEALERAETPAEM